MNHMISKSVMNKMNVKRQSVSAIAIGAFIIIALLIVHITSLDSVSHLSGGWVPCHTPMGSPVTRGRRLVERPILAYDFSDPCVRMPLQDESREQIAVFSNVAESVLCMLQSERQQGIQKLRGGQDRG